MVKPRFIHLHVRSDYSMIDGLSKVKTLVKQAEYLKMPALALTDFTNLFGLIKFYDYSYKLGIKPIIGSDFLMQNMLCSDDNYSEVTCLVANNQGYQNLVKLISKSYQYKSNNILPIINHHWLMEYNKGLIILSGGYNGDIGKYLLQNKKFEVEQCLLFYNKYFHNRYYIELTKTDHAYEELYLELAVEFSKKKGLPVVATNNVRFANKQDFQAHLIRVAIHNRVTLNKIKQSNKYTEQQFMKSEEDMCILFKNIPESLENSVEIAQRCNCIINLEGSFLPKFPTGTMSTEDFLNVRAKRGLEKRLIFLFPEMQERRVKRKPYDLRLQHELQVINQMGFPGYFLIVMEFTQWAKKNNIPVGPGRGSGASSLVAYALYITELDPLKFDLLFERFLNPERISMPDLDIDFCMEHRDLVINHVAQTYGINSVSQIITFGTMAAKASIRDVGRALGYPYVFVNKIAKLIPLELGITLDTACTTISQLKLLYNNDDEVKVLIDLAKQLEGIIRNVGKHAGGVVIAPNEITNFSPLYYDNDHVHPMTQFDKDDIERIGLIKFDFLGLRTLTTIDRSLNMINNQRSNIGLSAIDINLISLCDKKSFCMLQTAETTAVFQLESRGIKTLIKRLQPDCFEDLIALIALFRPGPLQSGMVDNFINRKHGKEIISYPDPQWEHKSLRTVLESTYGIILYQEQVMQIAQILAGYTLGKADLLRRAIGKKQSVDMAKQRSVFNLGAIRNGIDKKLSEKIFDVMEKFAGYGFNKSHSVAYALISYQTLWLKTHYPAEFLAAALSSDMDNMNKVIHLINECKRIGLIILPPDINRSRYHFYVDDNHNIIYGIGAIKGIGKTSIDTIVELRDRDGPFKGLFDFCIRTDKSKINNRIIEKLILSGAFDSFGILRSKLIFSLNYVMKSAMQHLQNKQNKQVDMFDIYTEVNINNAEFGIDNRNINSGLLNNQILLEKEKETLGLYLTNHPVDEYVLEIKQYVSSVINIKHALYEHNNQIVYIFGLLISVRMKISKKGNSVLFGVLEDKTGRLEIVVFSKLLKKYQYLLKANNMVLIIGIMNYNDIYSAYNVIVQSVQDINMLRKQYVQSISIVLPSILVNKQLLYNIAEIFQQNQSGSVPVCFLYKKDGIQVKLHCNQKWNVTLNDQLLINLRNICGYDQVKLELH